MRNNPSCLCDALIFYETLSVRGEGPDYRWGKRGSGPSRSLLQAVQGEWKPVSRAQIQPSRHTPLQTKQTCLSKEASLHVLGSACPSKFTHSFCLQDDLFLLSLLMTVCSETPSLGAGTHRRWCEVQGSLQIQPRPNPMIGFQLSGLPSTTRSFLKLLAFFKEDGHSRLV